MTATPAHAPVLTPYCSELHGPGGRCVYCFGEGFSIDCHIYECERIWRLRKSMSEQELLDRLKYLRTD